MSTLRLLHCQLGRFRSISRPRWHRRRFRLTASTPRLSIGSRPPPCHSLVTRHGSVSGSCSCAASTGRRAALPTSDSHRRNARDDERRRFAPRQAVHSHVLTAPDESETPVRRRRRRTRLAAAQRLRWLTGTSGNGLRQSRSENVHTDAPFDGSWGPSPFTILQVGASTPTRPGTPQHQSQCSAVGIICSNGGSGGACGTDRRKVPSGAGPGHRSLHRQHDSEWTGCAPSGQPNGPLP